MLGHPWRGPVKAHECSKPKLAGMRGWCLEVADSVGGRNALTQAQKMRNTCHIVIPLIAGGAKEQVTKCCPTVSQRSFVKLG